jgi:hypothetical protein
MKRLLAICMIVALIFTGCSTINSALNSGPVGLMCSPSVEQQATATAMLAALDAAQAAGAIFLPVLSIAKASAVLKVIQSGGCFVVAELKAAFEVVDSANVAVTTKQLKMLPSSPPALPEYSALRKLIK